MFLICTADKRFWKKDIPVVFLGEWCRLNADHQLWSKMNAEILDYRWRNRTLFKSDWSYLQGFYIRCLEDVVDRLNMVHGMKWGLRSWEILVGPWLRYFIEITFERYHSLQAANKSGLVSGTLIMDERSIESYVPRNYSDFVQGFFSDEYNQSLYSLIISRLNLFPYTTVDSRRAYDKVAGTATKSKPGQLFGSLVNTAGVRKRKTVVLYNSGFRRVHQILLELSLGQFPSLRRINNKLDFSDKVYSPEMRAKFVFREVGDVFEKLVRSLIPQQIPHTYMESFESLKQSADKAFPMDAKLVVSAGSDLSDDLFKVWLAEQVFRGAKFCAVQHGGGFGTCDVMTNEDVQSRTSDFFITWGWKLKGNQQRSIAAPAGKLVGIDVRKSRVHKENVLWVGTGLPRYSYKLASEPVGPLFLEYILEQIRFGKKLSSEVIKIIRYRAYHHEFGWEEKKRLTAELPDLRFSQANVPFRRDMENAGLIVSTCNSTTYLESLSANIPTVIFWNPQYWELRGEAGDHFKDLEKQGIFHSTPESAALHVNQIAEDPLAWWEKSDVQDAKDRFCREYARTDKRWLKQWTQLIRTVLKGSSAKGEIEE